MGVIDEIKQRLDIVDVVGGYTALEKAGRNFKALCPFHEERKPSLFVFPERQSWKCFGCSSGGDLVSFVMKKEGVDFSEALKMLAEKAGVSLARKKEVVIDNQNKRLYEINAEAAQYYHNYLQKETLAKGAKDYVAKRGLTDEAIADFQLGFSPAEGLGRHLLGLGYKENELLAVGVLVEKESKTYDFFRRRLMFPIRDVKGNVVGFGARALGNSLPKYLNSPQTSIFDKSSVLYGIDRAKRSIKGKGIVVIVEGYLDVIAAHQHNMDNVVGSMGTALTEKQMNVLNSMAKSLVFALDPDAAGDAATVRGIELARRSLARERLEMRNWLGATSKLKADIRIITLPQGKDPDDVIREDPQTWQRLVEQAVSLMDHRFAVTTSGIDLTRPEGKSIASDQLLPLIAELEEDIQREFYTHKLAELIGVNERTLRPKVANMVRTKSEKVRGSRSEIVPTARSGDQWEEYCLALLLQHAELRDRAARLLPEHFEQSENREVLSAWRDTSNVDILLQNISKDLSEYLESLLSKNLPPADEVAFEEDLAKCIDRLEERRLRLQDEFITSETVASIKDGEVLDSGALADLQQKPAAINAELIKRMQERTGSNLSNRGDQ